MEHKITLCPALQTAPEFYTTNPRRASTFTVISRPVVSTYVCLLLATDVIHSERLGSCLVSRLCEGQGK